MLDSIDGLPTHVLLIHAPIVLVPLAALVSLVATLRPRLRRRAWWLVPSVALIGLVATQLAVSSGYRFDEVAGEFVDTSDHEALGEATRNLVGAFVVGALATVWIDRRLTSRPPVGHVGSGLTTLVAVMSTIWMIRTGHEGARLVWDGVLIVTLR